MTVLIQIFLLAQLEAVYYKPLQVILFSEFQIISIGPTVQRTNFHDKESPLPFNHLPPNEPFNATFRPIV